VDLRQRQELNRGFGDGLARAFELAVTPVVFGFIGFGIDRLLGIQPVFTSALAVLAVIGMFIRLWYGYDLEMRRHESEGKWAKRS
jgi:hypothetical protein